MAETYDIVLSSPFSNCDFFGHKMREFCGQMSLSLFLVNDVWVKEFTQKLQSREISVKVMLDLTANQTIEDDPYLLLANHIPVPDTLVVGRSDLETYRITDEIKARLGVPFVVKPSWSSPPGGTRGWE
jgi:hypothetical protein